MHHFNELRLGPDFGPLLISLAIALSTVAPVFVDLSHTTPDPQIKGVVVPTRNATL